MTEEKAKKGTRIKKKKWIQVLAPISFKKEIIGEIYAFETQSLIGRAVTVNLMSLTRDMKQQNKNLKFVITEIEGDKAITELFGYYLTIASIRRLVRKGKKRIDLSFTCITSDKKKVRVKSLFIPNVKVKRSIAASLRKSAVACLSEHLSKLTFENAIKELMNYGLQRSLKSGLRKIYPIRILDISALYIEREKKPVEGKNIREVKAEEAKETNKEEVKKESPGEKPKEKKELKAEEVKVEEKAAKKEEKKEEKPEEKKEAPTEKKEEKPEEKKEAPTEKKPEGKNEIRAEEAKEGKIEEKVPEKKEVKK